MKSWNSRGQYGVCGVAPEAQHAGVSLRQAAARDANIITHMMFTIILIFIVLKQLLTISLYTRNIYHYNKLCKMVYFSSFL